MTTYVTVMQTKNGFDVFKFNGNSPKSIYPKTREKGVVISCWESNEQNDKYCFELAEKMNNGKN